MPVAVLNADDGLVPCKGTACTLCDLWQLGSNIVNFIVWVIAVPVASILFVVAGVIFITSGGREAQVTKARTIFTNVLVGLLLVFCSWLIVDTIFKTLAGDGFVKAWNSFPDCN